MKLRLLFLIILSTLVHSWINAQAFQIDSFKVSSQFETSQIKKVERIIVVGNRVTKLPIVLRELTFKEGDTLTNDELLNGIQQSKKNLLNTTLFNFARFDVALIDTLRANVIIQLTERWYIFPLPILEIDDNNFNTWWETKDFSRINYGMHLTHNNFRGRKETLTLTAQYGFTERYRLVYNVPYLTKNQKLGMSFSISQNRRDEIAYNSFNNERLLLKDNNADIYQNFSTAVSFSYRKAIFTTHSFAAGFSQTQVADTVVRLNSDYLLSNRSKARFFQLSYEFKHDKRDFQSYPLTGSFFKANILKRGIGLAGDIDLWDLQLDVKKFIELKPRFYFSTGIKSQLTPNTNRPYFLRNGLNYSNFGIRGYEYYVIDGQNITLARCQFKYQLVKPNSVSVGSISDRFGKLHYAFYLGIFSDAAYVQDDIGFPENNLANDMQFGYGLSIDFVSYYDIVLRTEYSFNKFGENGLFFHFVAPI